MMERNLSALRFLKHAESTKVDSEIGWADYVESTTYKDAAIDTLVALVLENTPAGSCLSMRGQVLTETDTFWPWRSKACPCNHL